MPFIDFTTGQVLTADQMDLVMRQSVMRFADAATRDTALAEVLAEGMVCYLDDTNEVLKYDGTDWVAIGPETITAQGDIIVGDAGGDASRLALGTAGQILESDGTALSYVTPDASPDDIITTQGDLIIGDGSGDAVRLPVGAADTVLTSDGTTLSFEAAGGGGDIRTFLGPKSGGTFVVEIEPGIYVVRSGPLTSFPVTLSDSKQILDNDEYIEITNTVTSLQYSAGILANIFPAPDTFRNLAIGLNEIIVVADTGVYKSTDEGLSYAKKATFSENLRDIKFENSTYLISGENGFAAFSTDGGETWTLTTLPNFSGIAKFAYSTTTGTWVAVDSGYAARSTDNGITWTQQGSNPTSFVSEVTFGTRFNGDERFISIGGPDFFTCHFFVSTDDGATWTQQNFQSPNGRRGRDLIFVNNIWMACFEEAERGIASSTDGGNSFAITSSLPGNHVRLAAGQSRTSTNVALATSDTPREIFTTPDAITLTSTNQFGLFRADQFEGNPDLFLLLRTSSIVTSSEYRQPVTFIGTESVELS